MRASTQPLYATQAIQPPRQGRAACLLLGIMLLTTFTLLLTVALFLRALPSRGEVPAAGEVRPPPAEIRHVALNIDGVGSSFETALRNPLDILKAAAVAVDKSDKIWVNGAWARLEALPAWTVPASEISIRRAIPIRLVVDGAESTISSAAATVGEALAAAGITLDAADAVSPPLASPLDAATSIQITRAVPLELLLDGVLIEARSSASTVAEALAKLEVPLFGMDYALPAGETALQRAMRIEIVRVIEETQVQTETIERGLRYQPDAALELDQRRVLQAGADGIRELPSRVRYENGEEISREAGDPILIEAPQDRIIAYGTKIVPGTVPSPEGPLTYWRRLCVYATRYNPTSNGGNTNTSTGARLQKGVIAAKPQLIPYYTRVYVPGYGRGEILDTGGGLRSTLYWIDLGYSDHDYVQGAGYTYVYLLGAPPADIDYLLPAWAPFSSRPGGCG